MFGTRGNRPWLLNAALLLFALWIAIAAPACADNRANPLDAGADGEDVLEDAGPDGDGGDAQGVGDAADGEDGEDSEDGEDAAPSDPRWPLVAVPSLESDFMRANPDAFSRLSRWTSTWTEETRPERRDRGALGVGNGHVFALTGYGDPINTLHNIAGPDYARGERFFGDYRVGIREAEDVFVSSDDVVIRSLSAPVVVTSVRIDGVEIVSHDLAPWTDDVALRRCLIRHLEVRNHDAVSPDFSVVVDPWAQVEAIDDLLIERAGDRALTTGFTGDPGSIVDGVLVWPLHLAVDESAAATLLHCASIPPSGDASSDIAGLPEIDDVGTVFDESARRWAQERARLIEVELPDPMVADFIEGAAMLLATQRASSGASSPMSRYAGAWMRDHVGAIRAWLALGDFESAARGLDFLFAAIVDSGDFRNSWSASFVPGPMTEIPDFASLPPLAGRVAAETPSYFVLMHRDFALRVGDVSMLAERWSALERAVFAQAFSPELLLPFTGDETFRTALNVALGVGIEFPHEEEHYSANSSLLWLAAAASLRELSELGEWGTGVGERLDPVETVRRAAAASFWLDEQGCVRTVATIDDLEVDPLVFEDVALKNWWASRTERPLLGDDSGLRCLLDGAQRPGVVVSEPGGPYSVLRGAPLFDGVFTGMNPGYLLSALSVAGHPQAQDAFLALPLTITNTGTLMEYHARVDDDEHTGLSFTYDPSGVLPDSAARYRPWETGIVLDALLQYLVGFDATVSGQTLYFAPHLPTDWNDMAVRGLRAGTSRIDLEFELLADGSYEARIEGAAGWNVCVRWDDEDSVQFSAAGRDTAGTGLQSREFSTRSSFCWSDVAQDPFVVTIGSQAR